MVLALERQLWALRRQLFCLDEFQMVWRSGARKWALERQLRDGSWMFQVVRRSSARNCPLERQTSEKNLEVSGSLALRRHEVAARAPAAR